MKKYYGNYLGLVVSNNDPERRGRVQVWVPHISAVLYENWNDEKLNRNFKTIGENVYSQLDTEILDRLKLILPWADYCAPVMGESSGQKFNFSEKKNTHSDSSIKEEKYPDASEELDHEKRLFEKYKLPLKDYKSKEGVFGRHGEFQIEKEKRRFVADGAEPDELNRTIYRRKKPPNIEENIIDSNVSEFNSGYVLNQDVVGENAGKFLESQSTQYIDHHQDNPYAASYVPTTLSNAAKGAFGVPNVGSHVWVFFREGNPQHPVFFGAQFSQSDFKSIYELFDSYPSSYENTDKKVWIKRLVDGEWIEEERDVAEEAYRNMFVLNQRGANIVIDNTENKEKLKFTHYSGSFLEFNNHTGILFLPKNFQSQVVGNSFETVRGNKKVKTIGDCVLTTNGDLIESVGHMNFDGIESWYSIAQGIHNLKKSFDENGSQISQLIRSKIKELKAIEETLGGGGNRILTTSGNVIETVGLKFNVLESYRERDEQKLVRIVVSRNNKEDINEPVPYIEPVHVDSCPGGEKNQTICNTYNLNVGSGGIRLKTTGNFDVSGTILSLGCRKGIISSSRQLYLDGGVEMFLRSDKIIIKHREESGQILMDRNVGILNDLDVGNDIKVKNDLTVGNDVLVVRNVVIEGTLQVNGLATSSTDFLSNGVSLINHTHNVLNIQSGSTTRESLKPN